MNGKIWFFPFRAPPAATNTKTTTTTPQRDDTGDECVFFRHKLTALQLVFAEKACVRRRPGVSGGGGNDADFDACGDSVYANLQRLWSRCAANATDDNDNDNDASRQ